jgi:hypothetical protein
MAYSMTKKELQNAYGVSPKTFQKWISKISTLKIEPGTKVFTPAEVETIFTHLGKPDKNE